MESAWSWSWLAEASGLLILAALLAPIAWVQHLVLAIPAIYLIVADWVAKRNFGVAAGAAMVLYIVLALLLNRTILGKARYLAITRLPHSHGMHVADFGRADDALSRTIRAARLIDGDAPGLGDYFRVRHVIRRAKIAASWCRATSCSRRRQPNHAKSWLKLRLIFIAAVLILPATSSVPIKDGNPQQRVYGRRCDSAQIHLLRPKRLTAAVVERCAAGREKSRLDRR